MARIIKGKKIISCRQCCNYMSRELFPFRLPKSWDLFEDIKADGCWLAKKQIEPDQIEHIPRWCPLPSAEEEAENDG